MSAFGFVLIALAVRFRSFLVDRCCECGGKTTFVQMGTESRSRCVDCLDVARLRRELRQ